MLRHLALVSSAVARARCEAAYRDYRIAVLASGHADGAIDVQATLLGGPRQIVRRFAFRSDQPDALAACRACRAELRSVIDDLSSPSLRQHGVS